MDKQSVYGKLEILTTPESVTPAAEFAAQVMSGNCWRPSLVPGFGAYLSGAGPLPNLRGANLRGADLRGANLRGADLEGADLEGALHD